MERRLDNVYRNIIVASSICGMAIGCMLTCKAAPSEDVIAGMARQLESGKTEFAVGYVLDEGETEQEAIHNILKMVRNYSDEAAKISFNLGNYCLDMNGSSLTYARFDYAVERDAQEALDKEYDRMYKEICGNIHDLETASNREKMNAILRYMAREFSYGYKNGEKEKYQLLESITQSKVMTCTGYSEIIDELCERMDIECRIIVNDEHAWNYIRLDDDAYIQIDGTMRYSPYVTYDDGYHKFDYQPMDTVITASIIDNIIFWWYCFPCVAIIIAGVFLLAVGEGIKRVYCWEKYQKGRIHCVDYRRHNLLSLASIR